MALTECAKGHLYDSALYQSCPYCEGNMNRVEFSAPAAGSGVGKTVAGGAAAPAPADEVGATTAPAAYRARQQNPEDSAGKTVAVFQKNFSREPVTGWLVCVEGAEKGKDYRIAARNNSIGRSESMDICIKGEMAVFCLNHARLSYDGKHNSFYLIPAESTNNVYINDEPVYVPTKLSARDVIELGESKFVFIPFCDDWFDWQKGMKKDK